MTSRGSVSVDERTNTLLVRDTAEALGSIRELVSTLDIPVRQVPIEARVVQADNSFTRSLGVRFGVSAVNNQFGTISSGGKLPGNTNFGGVVGTGAYSEGGVENLIVDLPIGAPAAALGLSILSIPDTIIQLELQALQTEGRGEVLANPRVVTSNQKEATIEAGTEIPYQEASSSGATATSFKKGVLALRVTPQITPDDRIIMDLDVSQDTVGQTFGGIPSVDTKALNTQVLVNNDDTVVLDGIFEQTKHNDAEKVPFFGDIPLIGLLFQRRAANDTRGELIIFLTPRIVSTEGSAAARAVVTPPPPAPVPEAPPVTEVGSGAVEALVRANRERGVRPRWDTASCRWERGEDVPLAVLERAEEAA